MSYYIIYYWRRLISHHTIWRRGWNNYLSTLNFALGSCHLAIRGSYFSHLAFINKYPIFAFHISVYQFLMMLYFQSLNFRGVIVKRCMTLLVQYQCVVSSRYHYMPIVAANLLDPRFIALLRWPMHQKIRTTITIIPLAQSSSLSDSDTAFAPWCCYWLRVINVREIAPVPVVMRGSISTHLTCRHSIWIPIIIYLRLRVRNLWILLPS